MLASTRRREVEEDAEKRGGRKKKEGAVNCLLVSTNTISVTIDLHSLIRSVLSLSVSVSAAMAMASASASERCVDRPRRIEGARLERVMYFSRYRQPHTASEPRASDLDGHSADLAKDAALLAPRWRSFWLSDRPGCASNASVGKLGRPRCCESERGETTRQAASPMKIKRLVATDRSEPSAEGQIPHPHLADAPPLDSRRKLVV